MDLISFELIFELKARSAEVPAVLAIVFDGDVNSNIVTRIDR